MTNPLCSKPYVERFQSYIYTYFFPAHLYRTAEDNILENARLTIRLIVALIRSGFSYQPKVLYKLYNNINKNAKAQMKNERYLSKREGTREVY